MLRLRPEHRGAIAAHAEDSYPLECCGFLLGRAADELKVVEQIRRAENRRQDSPRNRFEIEPGDFLEAESEGRARGFEVLGFYHSHPDASPLPSDYDREHAWPWYTYLIVPVVGGRAGLPSAWILKDSRDSFDEEAWT